MAETFHDVGDFVAAGERVAQLDDQIERLTLSIAEATAADDSAYRLRELAAQLGERTRTRNLNLDENNAISDQAIDQLETEFAAARLSMVQEARALELANIEVKRANALLEQRAIRTPIDGAVVKKYVSSGEYVDGQPVYQIAQLDPLHVEVIAPIEYLDTLTVGMQAGVLLQAPGYSDRRLSASVARIDAVADAASATYGVRLVLDNPDLSIPSGVRCSVEFLSS
jgi:RND family efflux transporter MFP subunit